MEIKGGRPALGGFMEGSGVLECGGGETRLNGVARVTKGLMDGGGVGSGWI